MLLGQCHYLITKVPQVDKHHQYFFVVKLTVKNALKHLYQVHPERCGTSLKLKGSKLHQLNVTSHNLI